MKPFSITRDMIVSMIEDVNENVTSVEFATVPHVVTAIMDSIREDAVWTESQIDVTESSIVAVVNEWIAERAQNDIDEGAHRIVEDVDASYDDEEIDAALESISQAIIDGEDYARLVVTALDLGASRRVIGEVIMAAVIEAENAKSV